MLRSEYEDAKLGEESEETSTEAPRGISKSSSASEVAFSDE